MKFAGSLLLLGMLASCASAPRPPPLYGLNGLQKRVSLQLPRFPTHEETDLAKDRGQVILLDFWATWCPPCKDALPHYQSLARQFEGRGFRVYAISIDKNEREIANFLRATKLALPVLLDKGGEVAQRDFGINVMPTSFLLDKQGTVRQVHEGFDPDAMAQYATEIEHLLQEP